MRRVPSQEWLDDDLAAPWEIRRSFDDLWRINRHLGGVSGCLLLLEKFFARTNLRHVRILDVGSGDARLAARLQGELAKRGLSAEFVAFDRRLNHLTNSNHLPREFSRVAGEASSFPFLEKSFDVVMCNLFLHHFSGLEALKMLQGLAAVASQAVLINDLERKFLPYFFIRIAWPFARSPVTRHDGAASVRQAYTREELSRLAREAGFLKFEVEPLPAFRMGLTVWKV